MPKRKLKINRGVSNAQKKVEERNFAMRKHLLEYDDVLNQQINSNLMVNIEVGEIESLKSLDELIDYINEEALKYYKLKEDVIPTELLRKVEKFIVLKTIDEKWRNHLLGMDQLREGIGLRAYGQKNPLIEYKSESYDFFQELMVSLRATVIQRVFHAQVSDQVQAEQNPSIQEIELMKRVRQLLLFI